MSNCVKNKQYVQNKECFSRMNFLFQASCLMSGRNNTLSSYYGELCRDLGKKMVSRLEPNIKRLLCKHCSVTLQPATTANLYVMDNVRKRKSRRKSQIDKGVPIFVECRECKHKNRFIVNSGCKFWLENPKSVLEAINVTSKKSIKYLKSDDINSKHNL